MIKCVTKKTVKNLCEITSANYQDKVKGLQLLINEMIEDYGIDEYAILDVHYEIIDMVGLLAHNRTFEITIIYRVKNKGDF